MPPAASPPTSAAPGADKGGGDGSRDRKPVLLAMLIGAFLSTGIFALFFGISLLSAPGFAPIGGALLIALGIGLACVAVSAAFIPDSHGKRPLPSSQHATRDEAGGRE